MIARRTHEGKGGHWAFAIRVLPPFLALLGFAAGCVTDGDPASPTRPQTSGSNATGKTPSPGPTAAQSGAGATVGPTAAATANTGTDVRSGIDTAATTAPVETLPPIDSSTPTPMPLGAAVARPMNVGGEPLFLGFLQNTVRPYVLRAADMVGLDANYQVNTTTYTAGIGQPAGLAADGIQDLWVLSASPPHVDRWELGLGGISLARTLSVAASPAAIAARDGEVWVGSAGGILTRIVKSPEATASFSGFGSPTAIAIGQDFAWVASSTGELFKVKRSDGAKVATFAVGPNPVGVAIDSAGNVWVARAGSDSSVRLALDGSTTSVALGATASAVVADARRIWFALPGKLSYWKPDGTKEGEAQVKFSEPMDGERALDPAALAIDAYGRIWTLDRQTGELLWLWGRKQGE